MLAALPLEVVEQIAPMAQLATPPGMPQPLKGILNLGGRAVPVLRLTHLLQLPENKVSLYSMLVITKQEPPLAVLVERVVDVRHVPATSVMAARASGSFNACVQATIQGRAGDAPIHVLSPDRILLQKERQVLSSFLERERTRLASWEQTIQ
jgi:purine-binding chemotaxis protein CheW